MDDDEKYRDESTESYEARMTTIRRKNYCRILLLSLKSLTYGYYIAIFNPIGDIVLRNVYHLDDDDTKKFLGNINMFFSLGGFFSVLVSGPLSERIGRRRLIMTYDMLNLVVIALYSVQNLYVLQAVRFCSGWICAGTGLVSNIFLTEALPKELSGVANTFLYAMTAASIFLAYIQQQIFSKEEIIEKWRLILCWVFVPALMKVIFLPLMIRQDSPKFFIHRHHDHPDLKEKLQGIYEETYRHSQVQAVSDGTIQVFREQQQASAPDGYLLLFTPLMRRRLATAILVAFCEEMNGMNYFSMYSNDLFNRLNGSGKQMTLVIAIGKVCAGAVAVVFMKFIGRKVNLTFSPLVQGLALLLIIISIREVIPVLAYIGLLMFILCYAIGFGGSTTAYITEILPPKGTSIALSFVWLFSAGQGKLLPLLATSVGDEALLGAFTVCCMLIFVLMGVFLIETKDKPEAKVVDDFKTRGYKFLDFR